MDNLLFEKINKEKKIKGVIQVGANIGQEIDLFKRFTSNIICFEPVPYVFEILKKNNTEIDCFNFGLGDKTEIKPMYISSNNGESSSFLKPVNHSFSFPDVKFQDAEYLQIRRFDELDVDMSKYNVLVSDTQGFEIKVMSGFGKKLSALDFILVEYIENNLYEGDNNLEELTSFVQNFGFVKEQVVIEMENVFGKVLFKKFS